MFSLKPVVVMGHACEEVCGLNNIVLETANHFYLF